MKNISQRSATFLEVVSAPADYINRRITSG